jgi:hypothetical protein
MKIGAVTKDVHIPEKGRVAGRQKYPFDTLGQGDAILIRADVEDGLTLAQMKKRITEAVRQYERRCGKVGGEKAKDFAVWIDEKADGVYVGLRTDLSSPQ